MSSSGVGDPGRGSWYPTGGGDIWVSKVVREHPALSRIALGAYAAQTVTSETPEMKRVRRNEMTGITIFYGQTDSAALALPQGVGEMFGYRLGSAAGVRVPRVTLTTDPPEDFTRHHVKQVPGGWMLSERVPASLPVYFLSKQVATSAMSESPEYGFRKMFKEAFDKRCPLGRDAYADFPQSVPEAALRASRWDSPERLKHYAYRALLGCTYPHSSNVLVTTDGELWLIDHEKICVDTEGDDLALLLRVIADSEAAIEVCRQVARGITPEAIEQVLADIRECFWRGRKRYARYYDPINAAGYFVDRLNRWNELFSERGQAHASFQTAD